MDKSRRAKPSRVQTKDVGTSSGESWSLTQQLQAAMMESQMSLYEIAKQSGVSASVLQRFVSGQRGITLETAGKIAKTLGLRLHG